MRGKLTTHRTLVTRMGSPRSGARLTGTAVVLDLMSPLVDILWPTIRPVCIMRKLTRTRTYTRTYTHARAYTHTHATHTRTFLQKRAHIRAPTPNAEV